MNSHFRSQVRLSCDGKLTRNHADSNFHPQSAIVILAPIWVVTLETQKCRKKAPRSVEFNFFLVAIDRNGTGFGRIKEEGQIYKPLPQIFNFCLGLSYDLSKFGDNFTPFFRL